MNKNIKNLIVSLSSEKISFWTILCCLKFQRKKDKKKSKDFFSHLKKHKKIVNGQQKIHSTGAINIKLVKKKCIFTIFYQVFPAGHQKNIIVYRMDIYGDSKKYF